MEHENPVGLYSLARIVDLPVAWLARAACDGKIPSLLVGRKRLFDVVAVRRALADLAGRNVVVAPDADSKNQGKSARKRGGA